MHSFRSCWSTVIKRGRRLFNGHKDYSLIWDDEVFFAICYSYDCSLVLTSTDNSLQ